MSVSAPAFAVDRYTILKKVADGGMAEIFLATQTGAQGFQRTVVCKRILPSLSADPQFRDMLVDEAHIAMSLNHSNIVPVLDLGEAEGRTFLVLDLVDGWNLATILARARAAEQPLPMGLILYITAEICRGLAYAHGRTRDGKPLHIVHRDISPQNVLISAEGEVKLTDFGIAKALGRRERTRTGVIKGKLDFMSPEQAAGAPLDARSDIFTVGSVLYLMATGSRPFEAASDLESLLRVQNAELNDPERVNPAVPPSVAAVIRRAMRRAPSERYATAEQMMIEVEGLLRADFRSVGQSDLKRWLDELRTRDGMPPISQTPGMPMEQEPETRGKTLALRGWPKGDPQDLGHAETRLQMNAVRVDDRRPPAAPPPPVHVVHLVTPAHRPRRRGGLVLVLLLLAGVGVLVVPAARQKARTTATALVAKAQAWWRKPAGKSPDKTADKPDRIAARATETPSRPAVPVPLDPVKREATAPAPERRPAPEPNTTVRLLSKPTGAVVRSGARRLGTTPLRLSLKAGSRHELVFSKKGYASVERSLRVGGRTQELSVSLPRARAKRGRR